MPVAVWDAVGTLLDLQPVRERFAALGAPHGLEAWFERIVHTGAALTMVGEFRPFADVASSTLPTVLAQLGLPHREGGPLESLKNELRPTADAAQALDALDDAGISSWIITNGSRDSTEKALARGELDRCFRGVVSIDDVRAWKPHPAPYEEGLRRAEVAGESAWMIAAHAWDVFAAIRHGLNAVWIDRLEQEWPLPVAEPEHRAPDLPSAAALVADLATT